MGHRNRAWETIRADIWEKRWANMTHLYWALLLGIPGERSTDTTPEIWASARVWANQHKYAQDQLDRLQLNFSRLASRRY